MNEARQKSGRGILLAWAIVATLFGVVSSGLALLLFFHAGLGLPSGHTARSSPFIPLTQNSIVIAGFKADFQPGQPKPGWHYYWNGTGAVGDTNAYEELRWNGGKNYVVGDADHPAPPSAKFLFLSNGKGHPGQGPFQTFSTGDENEHAIILAFTVPEAGHYLIRDSFITRQEGGRGGQVHLRVFVTSRDTGSDVYCRSMDPMSFDRELGRCAVGDRIYVCVGPDETDYHDSFGIDFAIGRY